MPQGGTRAKRVMKNIATDTFYLEDVFEEGWRVFRSIFAKCVPLVLVFGFLTNFLVLAAMEKVPAAELAERFANMSLAQASVDEAALAQKISAQTMGLFDNLFSFLVFSIALLAVVKCAERAITRRDITLREAFADALRRWPRYLWTAFLGGLIVACLCVFIIPGIMWMVYYLFVVYAVAMTSLSGKKALDYSKGLVKGAFWRTLGYFFVIGVATAVPALILALAGQMLANLVTPTLPSLARLALNALANAFATLPTIFQTSLCSVFFLNTAYLRRQIVSA